MGHLASDPPVGAKLEERDCEECGKQTIWSYTWHEGWSDEVGREPTPGWWGWECSGQTQKEWLEGRHRRDQ